MKLSLTMAGLGPRAAAGAETCAVCRAQKVRGKATRCVPERRRPTARVLCFDVRLGPQSWLLSSAVVSTELEPVGHGAADLDLVRGCPSARAGMHVRGE